MKNTVVQLGTAVGVLVALLVAYGAWYGFVAHETARDASLDQSIKSQSDTTARAAEAASELMQLGPQEAEVESHFVGVPDVVGFLQQLQGVGTREGAIVTVGSVSEDATPRPHLTIALTITGSFDAVMRTMGVIENGPYSVQTTQASLNSTGGGEWGSAMTVTVATRPTSATTTPSFFSGASAPPSAPVAPSSGPATPSSSKTSGSAGAAIGPRPTS
jgi:hypothetical protein